MTKLGFGLLVAAFAVGVVLLVWAVLMLAWNYVAVPVFGAPMLTFWQVALIALALGTVVRMLRK